MVLTPCYTCSTTTCTVSHRSQSMHPSSHWSHQPLIHRHVDCNVATVGIVEDSSSTLSPDQRAYNALFSTIVAIHQQEFVSVSAKVELVLNKFQSSKTITVDLQEALRVLKNSVSSEELKVAAYQNLLRNMLQCSEDLALMNLSILKNNEDLYQ